MDQSFAVPGPPFNLQLSHWDQRMTPMYSKRLLCFSIPDNTKERNVQIAHLLLDALRSTVEELPFLAGSVVPSSEEQPWLYDLRSKGAAHLSVKDLSQDLSFLDLREASFSSSLLDAKQLCPLPEAVYIRDGPMEVCHLQANFVDSGLILAVSVHHTVCDGRGISDVLNVLADKIRKAQTGGLVDHSVGPLRTYAFDRSTVLSGNGLHGDIENHPCWTASPVKSSHSSFPGSKIICTNFHISSDSLRTLKQATSSSPLSLSASSTTDTSPASGSQQSSSSEQLIKISTHDALLAFIWRSIIVARYRAGILFDHTKLNLATAVDCRTRLKLPTPYYGNAIYGVKACLTLSDLLSTSDNLEASPISSLQVVAQAIRAEIDSATAEKFRDLLAFVERTDMQMLTRLAVIEDLSVGSVLLVSYFWFGMHELDFGAALGGKIVAFRLPAQGLLPGMPVILPRLPDGGCEFVVNEREDVMGFLAEDEVFRRFAQKQH